MRPPTLYDSENVLSINSVRQRKGPRVREDDRKGMVRRTRAGGTLLLEWREEVLSKPFLLQRIGPRVREDDRKGLPN